MSDYTPSVMFDAVKKEMGVFTDKALADLLEVPTRTVTFIRTHRAPLNGEMIIRVHGITGWGIDYIRGLAGDESECLFKKPVGGQFNWKWDNGL